MYKLCLYIEQKKNFTIIVYLILILNKLVSLNTENFELFLLNIYSKAMFCSKASGLLASFPPLPSRITLVLELAKESCT